MQKKKIKRFIAMTMATIMVVSTNAFATPITLTDSTADASKTDTLDKINGTDYFADETTNVWQNGEISEEVRVNVDRASFFNITIPKEIVLNGNNGSANYSVSATGEIAGDQVISVVPDPTFTLNEDGGKTTPVTVTQDKDIFNYQDIDDSKKGDGSLSAPEISAGNWSGNFYFNIEFKDVSHTHNYTSTVTKQANCTEQGVKTYTCECGDTYTENMAIDPDNHGYNEGVVTKEATCAETGVKTYTCTRCNSTKTEEIAINSNNHAYDEGVVTKEATCTEKGVRTYTCSRCSNARTEEIAIDSTNHNYVAIPTKQATCTEEGVMTYTCTRCSDIEKTEPIPKLSHTYDEGVITKQPTCTETGIMTYTCLCGDIHLETVPINPNNHSYDEGVVTKEPTFTETGVKTYTCSKCDNTYTEVIPMKELPAKVAFNDMSWTDIAIVSEVGKAPEYFSVGDEKELTIGSETYHVQILGFNHDDKSDGSGKAGITVGLKEIMTTEHNMNSTNTNVCGWKDSKMRTYLQDDIYNALSDDVKAAIKPVNKLTSEGNQSTNIVTTSDKLFLLSLIEIYGSGAVSINGLSSGEGSQYQYFVNNNSKVKYKSGFENYWWMRSPYIKNTNDFLCVTRYGGFDYRNADKTYGVVFGFCI